MILLVFLILTGGIFCLSGNVRAEKEPLLQHLKEVNKIICKCKKEMPDCEKKLNENAAAIKTNATTMVDDVNSAICTGYLGEIGCDDIVNESSSGLCSVAELQKE